MTRNTINDRQRSGRPITISTSMRLRKGASIRNITAYLNRHGIKCSTQTVYNTAQKLKLKWFKTKNPQKLTNENKIRRVISAK